MKPTDKLRAWKCDSALERVWSCEVMLYLHGFITEAERRVIKARIRKWEKRHAGSHPDTADTGKGGERR